MPFDPMHHHRRSIRLEGYDYTQAGAYFVTVVSWQRECLFGEVAQGEVVLSQAGKIVKQEWFKTAEIRPNVELHEDEFILMPNHVHGIIWIVDNADDLVGAQRRCAPTDTNTNTIANVVPANVVPGSLGAIVRAFKSSTTRRIHALNGAPGAPVWQRNYYEHIIRNEVDLERIRGYIQHNPLQWEFDQENPFQGGPYG